MILDPKEMHAAVNKGRKQSVSLQHVLHVVRLADEYVESYGSKAPPSAQRAVAILMVNYLCLGEQRTIGDALLIRRGIDAVLTPYRGQP